MNPIEETFVKAFIARDSRDRWFQFLPSEKNRVKALRRLGDFLPNDFDPRFVYDGRNPPPQIAAQVEAFLAEWRKANPAQLCYIMARGEYDETVIPFPETAVKLQQGIGAVAIVIPDRLAYHYGENYLNKEGRNIMFRPVGLG